MSPAVVTTLITAVSTILVAIVGLVGTIWKMRGENRKQHGAVGETLARVETKVDYTRDDVKALAHRLDDHINGPQHPQSNVIVHPRHVTGGNSDVA